MDNPSQSVGSALAPDPSGLGTHLVRRQRRPYSHAAFTLIELLTVIAIIGILAAILIPTTSSARVAANKGRTRAQFAQWATAIEAFRQEYGYYPTFESTGAGANKVNGNTAAGTNLTAVHRFYETLVGTRRDGSALPTTTTGTPPPPQAQNTKRMQFISFTEADLGAPTAPETNIRGLIIDAFKNPDIAVIVDRNLDGRIMSGGSTGDVTAMPTMSPPDNTALRIPLGTTEFTTGAAATAGVRAGVIFYCAPPKATTSADFILSWK